MAASPVTPSTATTPGEDIAYFYDLLDPRLHEDYVDSQAVVHQLQKNKVQEPAALEILLDLELQRSGLLKCLRECRTNNLPTTNPNMTEARRVYAHALAVLPLPVLWSRVCRRELRIWHLRQVTFPFQN